MDSKLRPLSEVLTDIHEKFANNFRAGLNFSELAEDHECRARILRHIGVLIASEANMEHQKLLSNYFDEIFGDMVCSLYFFYTGLDVPGRMVLRRALELTLVAVAYWDNPAVFWAWNSKNRDISFTELDDMLSNQGFARFMEALGSSDPSSVSSSLKELRKSFGALSNVVHPKPYNFETSSPSRFDFDEDDLQVSLDLLRDVQIPLLRILLCRFPSLEVKLMPAFPHLAKLIS